MSSFASAVPQYAQYRSGYPAEQVARLAADTGLDARSWAVDIGCGTGQLALPLARHAARVLAIDPVPEMLEYGRRAATAAGVTTVEWVVGDSTMVADVVTPGAQLATFAASFHWTDRDAVLGTLDALLAPGASVVVLNDDLGDDEQPDWVDAIAEIRARYAGLEPAPGAVTSQPVPHAEVLARSAFADVRRTTWTWERRLDLDEVVGLNLTYSFSTPERLGDRLDRFCDEVRAAVLRLYPDGEVVEPYRVEVLTARRP